MTWLDVKLGARMLVKYPGLAIVGGLAIAFAIWVGAVTFQMVTLFVYPTLPFSAGSRIVQIQTRDVATSEIEPRVLQDFAVWRDGLKSVTSLGAWRDSSRNLVVAGAESRPVQVAEMSASGFQIADGDPLMGRVLTAADEQPSAPPVAVISYDVWRNRLASDSNVIGRSIQLGDEHETVVGVMREGFAFPVSHDVWLPLRTTVLNQPPRSGPAISIFGVLAPGATLQTAQAELTTLGRRAAVELPATHQHLEPRVLAYLDVYSAKADELGIMFSMYFFLILLLVLVCGNVGLLLFARAATRESDLIVRTALGASRARIVAQIFTEALVLGGVAATVGLVSAEFVLARWGRSFLEVNMGGPLPFWFNLNLSPVTMLFAVVLTVLGAAVAGVMPALKITRGMGDRLKESTTRAGGLKFGGVWTVVIVAQVAVTVAFPALVYWELFQLGRVGNFDVGFSAERFLTVRLEPDARNDRLASTLNELQRRVVAEPGVAGVTFVNRLPATAHPQSDIELGYDASATGSTARPVLREATLATIDPSYFEVLESPAIAGRAFNAADAGTNVAMVDQGFVDQVLQGRTPIGQQVRFLRKGDTSLRGEVYQPREEHSAWYEIVGVVKELGVGAATRRGRAAGLYLASTPERLDEIYMMVHVRGGDPMMFTSELRTIAASVDPALRLVDFQRADQVSAGILWVFGVWLRITIAMSAVAIVLSLAGIYAVLSFTVARRTREIGVRVALGASHRRVLAALFRRPLMQVAFGILAGTSLIFTVSAMFKKTEFPGSESGLSISAIALIAGYAVVMLGVCLLACIVPTRRALGVEPTVALRAD
jgi:predicted permease